MKISKYCMYKPENLMLLSSYASLYICKKKLENHVGKNLNQQLQLGKILDTIMEDEIKIFYQKELQKIEDYLSHNEKAEEIYCANDMYSVELRNGFMHKLTVSLLVNNQGLGRYELQEFQTLLLDAIESDIFILFEEIQRNLDGRYGVNYNELY